MFENHLLMRTRSHRQPSALWVSTSLDTRGGVASFVRMMRDTDFWDQWHVRHVATHRDGSIPKRIRTFLVALAVLVRELVLRRPAIVHVHMSSNGSFFRKSIVVWVSRLLRLPVVIHVHGGGFHQFQADAPSLLRRYIRVTIESAAAVVALGANWQLRLQALAPKAEVVVIPNAVRPGSSIAQPAPGEPVRVLFMGRVGEHKGTFELLDAWAVALGAGMIAQLTIAGDGEVDRARAQVAELSLGESVDILGWVPAQDVHNLLQSSHVLVLPSHNEGQPMAILEAMGHGLCVVATDTGGIPDLVDNQCGLLVPVGDTFALAAALARVVMHTDERIMYSNNALQRIRNDFDVSVVARRYDELYRSVLR
ncbi:glycosyltransferase family 4 protein [Nakamurella sp. GG22]